MTCCSAPRQLFIGYCYTHLGPNGPISGYMLDLYPLRYINIHRWGGEQLREIKEREERQLQFGREASDA